MPLARPPGHHAGPDYGGGFCYLNNVAVAAADQVAQGRRVAILDYDPHPGNGTSEICADDATALYVSTHQYGIYPGTGAAEDVGMGEGRGFNVNIPFTAGCGDASFHAAYDEIIEPIVRAYRPDVILVSLGVDAHYRDPLTSLALSSAGYVDLLARTARLAKDVCGRRLVVALEGGDHLPALAEGVAGTGPRLRGRRGRRARPAGRAPPPRRRRGSSRARAPVSVGAGSTSSSPRQSTWRGRGGPRSRRPGGPTRHSGTYDEWWRFFSVILRSFSFTIRR